MKRLLYGTLRIRNSPTGEQIRNGRTTDEIQCDPITPCCGPPLFCPCFSLQKLMCWKFRNFLLRNKAFVYVKKNICYSEFRKCRLTQDMSLVGECKKHSYGFIYSTEIQTRVTHPMHFCRHWECLFFCGTSWSSDWRRLVMNPLVSPKKSVDKIHYVLREWRHF